MQPSRQILPSGATPILLTQLGEILLGKTVRGIERRPLYDNTRIPAVARQPPSGHGLSRVFSRCGRSFALADRAWASLRRGGNSLDGTAFDRLNGLRVCVPFLHARGVPRQHLGLNEAKPPV